MQARRRALPGLNPGKLPPAYFNLGASRHEGSSLRDPDIERVVKTSSSHVVPTPPSPPQVGKQLTKKEKKAVSAQNNLPCF